MATSVSGRHSTLSEAGYAHECDFLHTAKALAAEERICGQQRRPLLSDTFSTNPTEYQPNIARRASSLAAQTAAVARYIQSPTDDVRGHMPIRAWGCRRVKPIDAALPVSHSTRLPAHGRLNKSSLQTVASLPSSAAFVDPIVKAAPKRACGGHTFTLPYHKQYNYYKYYGNAGQNALSAQHHNFPNGNVPTPSQVYSAGAMAAASGVSARDRVHASEGYQLRYGAIGRPNPSVMSQRDGCTQTPMTAIHYNSRSSASSNGNARGSAYLYSGGNGGVSSSSVKAGNYGYGGGQRPPQQRAASAGLGSYTTSSAVIGNRYAI